MSYGKKNPSVLYKEIKDYFSYVEKEELKKLSTYQTIEKNHGRIEKRSQETRYYFSDGYILCGCPVHEVSILFSCIRSYDIIKKYLPICWLFTEKR